MKINLRQLFLCVLWRVNADGRRNACLFYTKMNSTQPTAYKERNSVFFWWRRRNTRRLTNDDHYYYRQRVSSQMLQIKKKRERERWNLLFQYAYSRTDYIYIFFIESEFKFKNEKIRWYGERHKNTICKSCTFKYLSEWLIKFIYDSYIQEE